MRSINLTLPEPLEQFVAEQVARGGYASSSEYIQALILEARARAEREEVEAKLLEALRGGPAVPVTSATWEAIEREGQRRLSASGSE